MKPKIVNYIINFKFLLTFTALLFFASPLVIAEVTKIKQPLKTDTFLQKITFDVQKIKQLKGRLFYQLLACPLEESALWSELTILETADLAVTHSNMSISLKTTHQGKLILRVFQDINDNSILDYANNDIPKEPFGFSNNPNPMLGEPVPFETCFNSIETPEINIKMNIQRKRRAG